VTATDAPRQQSVIPAQRSFFFAAGWLVITGTLFQVFDYWQDRPLRKTALFVAIGFLCWSLWRWTQRRRITVTRSPYLTWALALAALLVLSNSLARGIESFMESRRVGDVVHDQGQIAHRALRLLARGVNPYGTRTMLDPLGFSYQVNVARTRGCTEADADAAQRKFTDYWTGTLDFSQMLSLPPRIADAPACTAIRRRFQSLGYHYGPVLLLAYVPLVQLLGPSGIYLVHLLMLVAWLIVLGAWLRKTMVTIPWITALSATTVFLLAPRHVNEIFLYLTASDLVATVLASVGLLLWLQGRDVAAAVLLAASVGSKLFPGLLFAPLLLRNMRSTLIFMAAVAALYLPFVLWDATGLFNNVLYPFTIQDTTSPLASLPDLGRTLLRAGAAVGFGSWILRLAIRNWPHRESLLFLVNLHIAALILGGMSKNNYLIWAMSVVAVFWIRMVDGGKEPAAG